MQHSHKTSLLALCGVSWVCSNKGFYTWGKLWAPETLPWGPTYGHIAHRGTHLSILLRSAMKSQTSQTGLLMTTLVDAFIRNP